MLSWSQHSLSTLWCSLPARLMFSVGKENRRHVPSLFSGNGRIMSRTYITQLSIKISCRYCSPGNQDVLAAEYIFSMKKNLAAKPVGSSNTIEDKMGAEQRNSRPNERISLRKWWHCKYWVCSICNLWGYLRDYPLHCCCIFNSPGTSILKWAVKKGGARDWYLCSSDVYSTAVQRS